MANKSVASENLTSLGIQSFVRIRHVYVVMTLQNLSKIESYSPLFGPVDNFVTLVRAKELAKRWKQGKGQTKKRKTLARLVFTKSSCPAMYSNVPVHRLQCVK